MNLQLYGILSQSAQNVSDYIYTDKVLLEFDKDTNPITPNNLYITSNKDWLSSKIDTSYGTKWFRTLPASGIASWDASITVTSTTKTDRTGIIRYTAGTAFVDISIFQYGLPA